MTWRTYSRRMVRALGGLFISAVLATMLLPGGASISAAATVKAEVAEAPAVNDYLFSAGFSSVQGGSRWYYQQWNGSVYADMSWDAAWNGWRGSCPVCIIRRDWVHPDANDAVIAWKAPRAGTITVRGVMDHGNYNKTGDGVRTVIKKRSGTAVTKVWPSAAYQVIRPNFTAQHIVKTDVQADDIIYFHVNKAGTTSYDTLSWDPRISYDYEPKFTLDQADLVMTPADFDRVGITPALDVSLSVVPNGTNLDFYHSAADTIQKFRGSLQQPAQTPVYNGYRFTNPRNLLGKWWIANIHRTAEGHLLAFCHIEDADPVVTGWWVQGLAYSTDGGNTFQKLGYTIAHQVKDTGHNVNIGGVPYVVKDGFFYAYFDEAAEFVARAPVSEVIEAAKRGTVSPWMKYFNGGWTEPGMHGRATGVLPYSPNHFYMTHGDAAYSTYLGRYLLTSYNHGAGRGVYLTTSEDGVRFDVPSWIQNNRWEKDTLSPYQTIVNIDGSDNGVVGQSFYVYYGYRSKATGMPASEFPTEFRWLYRQKVTLNAAGFDRNTSGASTDFTNKQGENDWRYLEYAPTTGYTELLWNADQYRWNGSAPWLMANSFTQHPDGGKDSVRAWIAPRSGTVRVSAAMDGIRLGTGTNADGVGVRIAKQGVPVWPASGYHVLPPGTVYALPPIDVTVAKGEALYFHVNQNGGTAYDTVAWDPVVTYVGLSRITYNGWIDYAGVQGNEGWSYYEYDGVAYTPMSWNAAAAAWQGSASYLLVRPTVQHPDAGKDSVRAWVAPRSGTVRIRSALGDITVATGAGADGVRVRVLKNSGNVWPATGYGSISPGTGVAFNAIDVTISQGDTLYFHVNQNGGTAFDTVSWVPVITYREA